MLNAVMDMSTGRGRRRFFRRPSGSSLRSRLALLTLLTLLPAVVIAIVSVTEQRRQGIEAAQEQALQWATLTAEEHYRHRIIAIEVLQTLARFPEVRSPEAGRCPELLGEIHDANPLFVGLAVADLQGNVVCSTLPLSRPASFADRAWFQEVVATRAPSVGVFQVGTVSNVPAVPVGHPVVRDGRLVGVLSAGLDLTWLNQTLQTAHFPPEARLTLFDRDGVVLVRYPDAGDWIGRRVPEGSTVDIFLDGSEGRVAVVGEGFEGEERVFGLVRLDGGNAYAALSPPTAVAFADANRVLFRNLAFLGGGLVLALAAAWTTGYWFVVRPVRGLLRATRLLGGGDYGARLGPPYQASELGGLALEFDAMAAMIEARNEERKQAEAALREADRRKDEFLAMLSHELRNPLAPLAGAVHLLNDEPAQSPAQREVTGVIERQVAHLSRLVDDLLEVSRITTGRIRLRRDRIMLSGIVNGAVEMMSPVIARTRQDLYVSLPAKAIQLDGDEQRLTQVLVNLLVNASKFTPDGGSIRVTAYQMGDQAVVRVQDTGIGIDPESMPHIFDLFVQGQQGLAHSKGGLGIGLTLARSLVEMHGGRLEAYSAGPGQGSTFSVYLPVLPVPALDSPAPAEESGRHERARRLRVLLVDDNVDMTRIFGRQLQKLGHQVHTANSGKDGLKVAVEYLPDVVLLDIGLPDMDGYEVARQMRQKQALRNVVLIAMTGYGSAADRTRALESGFDHHLVKPADMSVLKQILATTPTNE